MDTEAVEIPTLQTQSLRKRCFGGRDMAVKCYDCDRPYGDEFGFPDLIIPNYTWRKISPTGDEGGLLCPSCICGRLYEAGIKKCEGSFMSGPIESVSPYLMRVLRQIENIQEGN